MTLQLPLGARAIMNSRIEPPDSLDYFPTPPWATRALCEIVLGADVIAGSCAWDPACGEGHMVETLAEYFQQTAASDIHDYGRGYAVQDYLTASPRIAPRAWTITNPPFNQSVEFALQALNYWDQGVAMFVRTASWLETEGRYNELFARQPPTFFYQFVERVSLVKGRYDPAARTATGYGWAIWMPGHADRAQEDCRLRWIPPCKDHLFRPEDAIRWCPPAPLPLFDGASA